jgi:ATP-grasp in the biosynthetic pathway with Ter operon
MNKQINVLIFPCGKENALELHESLKYNVNVKVFGASSVRDHGALVYENYIGDVPYIQAPGFITAFKQIIKTHKIDVVIPTHDTVTLFFAEHKSFFECTIVCPELDAALVCREKLKTYALFKDCNFVPRIYQQNDAIEFPVFLKPNIGEGSKYAMRCETQEKLETAIGNNPELIICGYLPGKEFTVDCFTNYKGELLFAGPRLRNRVQMGIAFNSTTHPLTNEIEQIAATINERIRFNGLWYFQLKEDADKNLKLLEVSARVSGTMVVYRMTGVNFGLLSVYNALGKDVSILKNNFEVELDRCLHNRYVINIDFDTIYIDYDDTIIVNEKVNDMAMQFIYQMLNNQKKIVLLTRHAGDLSNHMAKFRIAPNLFDAIHHLTESEQKTDYIANNKAIFIDNAFAEREAVFKTKGIPVFDVDAIACFII